MKILLPGLQVQSPNYFLWVLVSLLIILLVVLIFAFLLKYKVDVTTRALWRRNRQLTLAKEKAEENERLKTIFLQNMSHEIRTPMNGIIGFLSLLKQPDLDAESRQKYIDIVSKSGKRLLTTINNIIEISKIDSKQIEVRNTQVDLIEILNFYYNFFLPQAKERKLEFRLNCLIPPEDATILTDKFILDNILTNLINNALKFTKQGSVELGASVMEKEVLFYVKDTGIGIPKERQNAIFERFVQANLSMTRAHEGSGLGLAIVKAYVEILKGKIWLESREGEGSTFSFTIPYVPSEAPQEPDTDAQQEKLETETLKILIAEDDNISFLFIQQLLKSPQITLLRAKDGSNAVELARRNPDLSLILMDIKMPLLNGIEATHQIRQFNPSVPIIAQSAYTFSGEQEQAIKAGCNDYITKPINKNILLQLIKKYTQQ
ncbi:hybrid sensor histidine kinase/response regulator [Salinimicrobium oceani]|uniref:histidine kinase n=1 Tax=Salinimicrobium oceani TaxID=2722702 RepID=A0ABX1CUQ3_9FLAO|nr:ATP-binding protein [Salinimicrobium oceani]NJW51472.1 response regulator [Salinimicrobium oceani]